ncbi:phosphate acetyltransferase [Ochrobactrum intermedium]|uniref:Phosphate acetyltransferase n=1 Tax=Brucella intermedia TaxID=94625 RepID=A0ABR6AMQ3_9HYPH|nr:phosphate acetyltransferase [Brucella intermedia]KAB2710902.1 phosphate acetyltransferase [Brucella intermedia]MBA8850736.1 phosphate acetyltransferase [Brucella intermedia]NYD81918.1 phosphate acetyltransferase [Brucella intermedia]
MQPLEKIFEKARSRPRHIVLAEGEDPRIIDAALRAEREGIARITLLGSENVVGNGSSIAVIDPKTSDRSADYAHKLYQLRQTKGMTEEQAETMVRTPLGFAAMMVREGDADGTVAGAVATTADVVRHALQIIGKAEGASLVSSFFLMLLCQTYHQKKGAFVFADCGLVVEPDAAQLADIAIQAADSYRQLTEKDAAVAMLSFSTGGSAAHERVSKVVQATRTVRDRMPDLCIDGELQFDTAFVEAISHAKSPDSPLKGNANVFVFPNLEAANIGYKIAQRIGGAQAIGPVLQGLAKPANDLSRGCSADDVLHMIAITVNQAK